MSRTIRRLSAVVTAIAAVSLVLSGCSLAASSSAPANSSGPVYFGVSAPLTGDYADYGKLWKEGFQIALDRVNADGGIDGRPVALKWEDTQSDPKQSTAVAQKFVADNDVIAELGDFSSNASIAASPIYTNAKLLQFGFTNSNPNFTLKGSEYQWSTSLTQDFFQDWNAKTIKKYANTVSVVYLESDWGKNAFSYFQQSAAKYGLNIVFSQAIDPQGTDYRPTLIQARDAHPDAVVHIGYGPDGVLVANQLRDVGYTGRFFGGQNVPEFASGAAKSAEGDIISGAFLATDTNPDVQAFVKAFETKYPGETPGDFNVYAYDALIVLVTAARNGGATREGILKGLQTTKTFPSLQWGDFSFDTSTRRPANPQLKELLLKNGQFVLNNQ